MSIRDEIKRVEDAAQAIELWLFKHQKEVDAKRLESYDLLKRISDLRERDKVESKVKEKERVVKERYRLP